MRRERNEQRRSPLQTEKNEQHRAHCGWRKMNSAAVRCGWKERNGRMKETIEVKTEYKRDLQNNYLILEAPEADAENNYGLRMAEQNQVKGLLPLHESRKDGKLYLHYEITSKQTLESVYEKRAMDYQDILFVLSGIRDTLENMRKYLLSPQKLLFAPEMIYVQPEQKGLQLCYYAEENECPIQMLAEFILKRLDHRDRQAVALGYGFFERASGENFSLTETLKDILKTFGEAGRTPHADDSEVRKTARPKEQALPYNGMNGGQRAYEEVPATPADAFNDTGKQRGIYDSPEEEALRGSAQEEPYVIHRERSHREWSSRECSNREQSKWEQSKWEQNDRERGNQELSNQERSGGKRKGERLADCIFSKVHPAVLLSTLALTAVLEVLIMSGILSLTESGGCFFLMLSVEILINRRIFHRKTERPMEWETEEENEEYRKLMQETYQDQAEQMEPEPIEETRCLIPKEEDHSLRLVCCSGTEGKETWPDISPGSQPVYIGKIKGEADVILNVSTVSRMHARIQMRQNQCFLKDMNSKNGTFVNGRRLEPQEECEIGKDDTVAFAQVAYRVVQGTGASY
ncbi:MAG: FHA domain-containing protein [Lachnospiraceae bacterium]|nr:FHA domain-containing protein [Lachnospiraceae bacterium]